MKKEHFIDMTIFQIKNGKQYQPNPHHFHDSSQDTVKSSPFPH